MMVQAWNPSTWEVEAGSSSATLDFKVSLRLQGQPEVHIVAQVCYFFFFLLYIKFCVSLLYSVNFEKGSAKFPRLAFYLLCSPGYPSVCSSCLCLPNAEIRGLCHQCHQAWFSFVSFLFLSYWGGQFSDHLELELPAAV